MLHYQILNNPKVTNENNYLVFIAGFTGTIDTWSLLITHLKQLNFRHHILLIDNIGAGKSPQPDILYTTELMATEIMKVINFLGLEKVSICGHSLGGAIAQQIGIMFPSMVDKLFLISTFPEIDEVCSFFLRNRYEMTSAGIDKAIIAKTTLPSIFGNRFLSDAKNIEVGIARIVENPQTIAGMIGQLHACLTHNATMHLKNISSSAIVVHGEHDLLVNPLLGKKLLTIPNSNIHMINNCGHMIQLEYPEQLAQIIAHNLK